MSKGLEALKSLGEHHCSLMQKCESEECNIPCYECKYLKKEKFIEKELKALEIIKEKGLSVNEIAFIKNGESWKTYVETMKELCWADKRLDKVLKTQEEYDILTEVML